MHRANWKFWKWVRSEFREHFKGKVVLEAGSMRIAGMECLGDLFREMAASYTGVDHLAKNPVEKQDAWRKFKGLSSNVDLVSLVHELTLEPGSIDTIVSASMLEHDGYLPDSVTKMVELLRPGGLLCLSWGAAHNLKHGVEFDSMKKGKFYRRPAELVVDILEDAGMWIQLFKYERNLPYVTRKDFKRPVFGHGEVVLIAHKGKPIPIPETDIDEYLEKDRLPDAQR